jgi:hypothetical protein
MTSQAPKRSLFELLLQVGVPATVSIVLVFRQERSVALGLVAAIFLSLGISFAPAVIRAIRRAGLDRKEKLTITKAQEDLNRHIRKFEHLVSTRTANNLHHIVTDSLCQNNAANYAGLFSAPATLFSDLEEQLISRMNERKPSFKALRDSIWEFTFIVSEFSRQFVCPVYENVPRKLSTETLRSYNTHVQNDLIQFRERYIAFLDAYADFLRDLDQTLPRPIQLGYFFERPKPVQSNVNQVSA